jgi:hypothetical protein
MTESEMIAKWDEHIGYEFSTRDVSSTIATMVEDAYVNHVPVMSGGYGHAALRRPYAEDFISLMPADTSNQRTRLQRDRFRHQELGWFMNIFGFVPEPFFRLGRPNWAIGVARWGDMKH